MYHYKYFTVKKWADVYFERFYDIRGYVRHYTRCVGIKEIKIDIPKEGIRNLHINDSFKVGIRFRDLMSKVEFYIYLKSVFGNDMRGFTIQQRVFEDFESFNTYKNNTSIDGFYDSSEEEEDKSSSEDQYDWESMFECDR